MMAGDETREVVKQIDELIPIQSQELNFGETGFTKTNPFSLGQFQWPVSMHCFQNKSADRASMKWTMKQSPQCMSFTLMFPRLGKIFNYCKMIGSHARWWNDLVLSGDFILFYRVETTPAEFHHGETNSFSLLFVSCKKCSFADMTL